MVSETPCELNDFQWIRCRNDTDVNNWTADKLGNRRIGVALVGLGRMGLIHFRNLLREPRAKLLYCIDSDHGRLVSSSKSMFFREFGIRALHSDQYEVALNDPQVSVVLIATPTHFHEDQTRLALLAGKSVMCEKPLTPITSNIMPLYELAKANKVFLMTAFNRRYDPDYRHMRSKLLNSSIGSLQMVRVTARDCQPPPLSYVRLSGGLFHDTCIHDIDLCLWLARQLPVSLQVLGKTWREFYLNDPEQLAKLSPEDRDLLPEVNDYFMAIITMKFPDGSLAVIDNSRQASYGYDQRCELYGSRGMLRCDGRHAMNVVESNDSGITHPTLTYGFASRFHEAYLNELRDILSMAELAELAGLAANLAAANGNNRHQNNNGNNNNQSQADGERDKEHTAEPAAGAHEQHANGANLLGKLERQHLLEPVRASLVLAAHTIADACAEAAKTGHTLEMNWPDWLRRQFELEMDE
jgi:myo-inositol 2-dehydrogenase/D-chiro-inositol 1-dehydrogenase